MIHKRWWEPLPVIFVFLQALSAQAGQPVVYGEDNRQEVYQAKDPRIQDLSRAVVLITRSHLSAAEGIPNVSKVFPRKRDLQDFTRLATQAQAGDCTGFLIDSQHVLTAGHCMEGDGSCKNTHFIFDFKAAPGKEEDAQIIPDENVVGCKRFLRYSNKRGEKLTPDYALLRLDHPMVGRPYFKLRSVPTVPSAGTPIAMLGHPTGVLMKYTDGAQVLSVTSPTRMTANLDAFGGNSGSPVFNATSLELFGILVSGPPDYQEDEQKNLHDRLFPEIPSLDRKGNWSFGNGITLLDESIQEDLNKAMREPDEVKSESIIIR